MNNIRKLLTTLLFTAAFMLLPCIAFIPAQAEENFITIDYKGYDVRFAREDGSPLSMITPPNESSVTIVGDNVVIHFAPKRQTYVGIHWGTIKDSPLTTSVELVNNAYDITLPKSYCGHGIAVAMLKKDGTTTTDQYYLCIPAEKIITGLDITNTTSMFNARNAFLKQDVNGVYLELTLSNNGTKNLFKGTYEEAVANGDNRANWIVGVDQEPYEEGGKIKTPCKFVIRLEDGESYIPLVGISQTYLDQYDAGTGTLERAFYPRQVKIDYDTLTLEAGDYKGTTALTLTNNTKLFDPKEASFTTLGGPNSNNYNIDLNITMADDSYDAMFVGDKTAAGTAAEDKIIKLSDEKTFTVCADNIKPDKIVLNFETPLTVSFRDKETKTWRERSVLAKKSDKTIVFDTVDEDQAKAENAEALIKEAAKDYPTAAEKQAAVKAAQDAYGALTGEQQEKLKEQIPDPDNVLSEAQKAADAQKEAEEKANEDKGGSKDDGKDSSKGNTQANTPKKGDKATVGKFVFKVTSAKNATLLKPLKKTNKKVSIPTSVKIKGKTFKVTAIANNAFKNNKKLTKITVPASVTTIGKNAFRGCKAAKSITIGKKVKTIGNFAFYGCKKATKLIIKGTAIKKFGKKSFAKTGIKKLIVSNKKKKAAYRKKLIKAGMSKKAK